jgi:hypothetical protein
MDKLSQSRLAENEVIFRSVNSDVQQFITSTEGDNTALRFYCECSRLDCRQRILLSAKRYQELHKNKRQFIALTGHEQPEIEKIVKAEDGFNVIEKYQDPPSAQKIRAAVKAIQP